MSECIEPKYRDMLHAFELGILPDHDTRNLEVHLLQCDHCFETAQEFSGATRLLREDKDIKDSIIKISKKKALSESPILKILTLLWPEKPRFILAKPVSIFIMLLIISIPVYKILLDKPSTYQQTVNLFPLRGGEKDLLSLEKGGKAIINFVCEDAGPGIAYHVEIAALNGDILYSNEDYSDFNESGMATIIIPLDSFNRGRYTLIITDKSIEPPEVKQKYYFSVE
jgi:hypothetical protein